ncbi:hypothetical protein OWV82_003784 [Melia azedarach]|uniref:Uncharacterized protein n=1 Tax=Melia azedarach TaxID=155640 RepID=A0ACC1YP98_MELAZ|nr:hypothetical protein OWV82_003784 [Melia azedarach]
MGFAILSLYLFLSVFIFHLLSSVVSQENPLLKDFDKKQHIHQAMQEKLTVNRRGSGGGGHGVGGHAGHGGSGGHIGAGGGHDMGADSHGHNNGYTQGGAVIPLYAAGGSHRRGGHHDGSNDASRIHGHQNHLLFVLISLAFVCSM